MRRNAPADDGAAGVGEGVPVVCEASVDAEVWKMTIQELAHMRIPAGEVVVAMISHCGKIVVVTDRGTLFVIDTSIDGYYWPPGT